MKKNILISDLFFMTHYKWNEIKSKGILVFILKYFFFPFGIGIILIEILIDIAREIFLENTNTLPEKILETLKFGIITYPTLSIVLGLLAWFLTNRYYNNSKN